ncbi:MAG TPA: NUDIX domain-containing protein [Candidatus Saccharimonadales bacterium]|nr:NUDIX domain-containing protein [Candidatus Saccharimonadales bacterium]
MEKVRQRIACKAVIEYTSKVLILREASTYIEGTNGGRYHLPGGRIEPGEPYKDGLAREVLEETGLQVTLGKPLYAGEWFPIIRGEQNQIVATFFDCKAQTDEVRLSNEHDDYRWIDPMNYAQYDLMAPEDKVFEALLQANAAKPVQG